MKARYGWWLLALVFAVVFKTNCLDLWNTAYKGFQYDSEDLAIGAMTAAHYRLDMGGAGLGRVNYREKPEKGYMSEKIYRARTEDAAALRFGKYDSQYGLQGRVYAAVSSLGYFQRLAGVFRWGNALLLGGTLVSILYLLRRRYGAVFAAVWGFTFLGSPWIVNFAPNLYWVEFTWFVPMLLGLLALSDGAASRRGLCALGVAAFLSVCVKALCGYEYLSSILIGMALFPAAELAVSLYRRDGASARALGKRIAALSVCALLGFACAFALHAAQRGRGDIRAGVESIYQRDVLRRTALGTTDNFSSQNPRTMESVRAPALSVVKRYFNYYSNHFHSNIVFGLDGRNFILLSALAGGLLVFRLYRNPFADRTGEVRLGALWGGSLLAALSWFVLAKGHSYIHVHMNYVLWFFGYVQMCFFVILDSAGRFFRVYLDETYAGKGRRE